MSAELPQPGDVWAFDDSSGDWLVCRSLGSDVVFIRHNSVGEVKYSQATCPLDAVLVLRDGLPVVAS